MTAAPKPETRPEPKIFGYTDRFAARPGESLSFHVSCEGASAYQASLVRLRHGFTGEAGPGFLEAPVRSEIDGEKRGRRTPASQDPTSRYPTLPHC